ncbi:Mis12 protein-domain-containing protein [Xylogone sp. PMI_703]|nr:Mis12 protein-domain-containing protein [Xylogone sp. PMI_703]
MSALSNSDTALLTEHLTYRPAALIDDIINSINTLAFKAMDAVENGLLSTNPADLGFRIPDRGTKEGEAKARALEAKIKHEIENGVHQLETLLESKIDTNFDKLEIYALRSILSIPPEVKDWMRLSHYEGLNFTNDADAPTPESIALQRRKLRETQKLHTLLVSETERNEATIAALKALLSTTSSTTSIPHSRDTESTNSAYPALAFLQNKGDLTGDVSHPISTTTSFTLSQLPALKLLLARLKPRLQELANANGKAVLAGNEEKSWRKERLEFIETQTRKHLENVRGLELGEMGEVRDGEWQGEGRTLGKDEVNDLERIVAMIGGGEEAGSNADGDPMEQDS